MALYNRQRARRSILDTILFRVGSQVATLVGYVVLVRGTSVQDFGVLNVLYSLIPVISTTASLGIEQVLRRYQPEYLRGEQFAAAHWLVRTAGRLRLTTSLLFLSIIAATWTWIAPVFQLEAYRHEYWLFCPLIVLHFQARILQLALSTHLLQRYAIGMVVAQSFIKLIAYSVLAYRGELTLAAAVIADTIGYAVMYAGLKFAYERHCRPKNESGAFKLPPDERKRLLKYAIFNNFNDAGALVLTTRSDNFFIAAFIDPAGVAAYSFYNRFNEMIQGVLPMRLFSSVIQPFFYSVPAEEAPQKLPRYFTFLINLNLIAHLPLLAYAIAYHREIVGLIAGSEYIGSSWMLPIVIGSAVLNVIAEPSTMIAQHSERSVVILLSKFFAIYNVIALLALLPVAGIYGAAVATGSAAFFKNLFIWWHVRKLARWLNAFRVVGFASMVWGGAVLACLMARAAFPAPDWCHLFAGAAIVSVATLIYIRTPAIASSDRELLQSLFHGRELRLLGLVGLCPRPSARR